MSLALYPSRVRSSNLLGSNGCGTPPTKATLMCHRVHHEPGRKIDQPRYPTKKNCERFGPAVLRPPIEQFRRRVFEPANVSNEVSGVCLGEEHGEIDKPPPECRREKQNQPPRDAFGPDELRRDQTRCA